jgi:hypothetical protein
VRKGAIRGYLVSNFFDLMMWKVVKVVLPDAVTALLKVAMLSVGEEERSKEGGCLAKRCMREMKRSREREENERVRKGVQRRLRNEPDFFIYNNYIINNKSDLIKILNLLLDI